jgi:hypothetical protein
MAFPRFIDELRPFWEARLYDFNVYSQEKKNEKRMS